MIPEIGGGSDYSITYLPSTIKKDQTPSGYVFVCRVMRLERVKHESDAGELNPFRATYDDGLCPFVPPGLGVQCGHHIWDRRKTEQITVRMLYMMAFSLSRVTHQISNLTKHNTAVKLHERYE